MSLGLYRAATGMIASQRHLEKISTNLANLGTVGFKRSAHAVHSFDVQRPGGGVARGLRTSNAVNFVQGELDRTGRNLDLALVGDGFFAIEGPDGEVYTRDGSFHMAPDGILVTEEGFPLAWSRFNIPVNTSGPSLEIDGEGTVRQGSIELGQLRIVNFSDRGQLYQDGRGYWAAPPDLPQATQTATVHQGALEASNATGMGELIEMIAIQRAFDASAQTMTSIQESYRRLTRPF